MSKMKIFNWIYNWFRQYLTKPHFKEVTFVSRVSEIPDDIKRTAYIVERGRRKLWLVFDCPCNSGHRLTVNLSEERKPFWSVKIRKHKLSVSPSIWLHNECQSHFWIENSGIVYTQDSRQRI